MKKTISFALISSLLLTSMQLTPIAFVDSNTEKYKFLWWSSENVQKYLDLGVVSIPLTETYREINLFTAKESRRYLTSRLALPIAAACCVALGYVAGKAMANTSNNKVANTDGSTNAA